jgi:hypothetical protein
LSRSPARGWAIDVIERDSGIKFNPVDRQALLHKPIKAAWIAGTNAWSDAFMKTFQAETQKLLDEKENPPKTAPAQ